MISMFSEMKYGGQSAATLRQRSLRQNSQYWQLLRSNVDCFICLQRKPEHKTECGHGICDTCVSYSVFSKPTEGKEYHYDISTCPQCRTEIHFQARVLPPTCRVRALSIDGGGSRGVVSLAFMEKLQQALDLSYPVQEHFDFCIGTSSGELLIDYNILVLIQNRWYCNHWALWQALEPQEMSGLLSQVCKKNFPIQGWHETFRLCSNQTYLCVLP